MSLYAGASGAAPGRRVRVMHVLARDAAAGTELMTATLAERSPAHGVDATVVTMDAPGVIAQRLASAGVPVRSLGSTGALRGLLRLARLVRADRPDVICGYGFRTGLATRLVARTVRPRVTTITGVRGLFVTEVETLDGFRGRLVMAIERLTAPLVDAYIANSTGAAEVLARYGVPRERLHVVPNGIDAAPWTAADRVASGVPLVVCVGRFTPVKHHGDIVEAAALLRDRGIAARFTFAGTGPLLETVRARAQALGLASSVEFLGAIGRNELVELLRQAELACLASSQEGMPGSVMEAMASGLAVIGTDVNGIRDLVVDGQTGLLVPPGQPAALADALEALISDAARRSSLGAAGRERIVAEFSLSGMVARTADVQRGLVEGTLGTRSGKGSRIAPR